MRQEIEGEPGRARSAHFRTSATTMGVSRTEDNATAKAAAARVLPDMMPLTSTTFAGSAQTTPVMNTVSGSVSPASLARPAKPTKAEARIRPGMEKAAAMPRKS